MSGLPKLELSPAAVVLALLGTLLVLAGATWLLLISPKRTQATNLSAQIQSARVSLELKQHAAHHTTAPPSQAVFIRRALPDTLAMPQVILELSRVAGEEHVTLDSITPQASVAYSGFEDVPLTVDVSGHFFAIESFLRELRGQVQTGKGTIAASGRLFDVQAINLSQATTAPGLVSAILNMDVYYYSGVPLAPPCGRHHDHERELRLMAALQVGAAYPTRGSRQEELAKAKEHRQKITLALLGVVLLAVLAFELPPLLSGGSTPGGATLTSAASAPAVARATTPATSAAGALAQIAKLSPTDPFVAQLAPTQGAAPGATNTPAATRQGPGVRASHFVAKDPFVVQIAPPAAAAATPVSKASSVAVTPGLGAPALSGSGYLVVFSSVPAAHGASAAERAVVAAQNAGIPNVSVVHRSAGALEVGTGPYATKAEAQQELIRALRDGYTKAQVVPLPPHPLSLTTMASYSYSAVNAEGFELTGQLFAPDVEAAKEQLRRRGLLAKRISEAKSGSGRAAGLGKRVDPKALQIFSRQFATLIEAGVSIVSALLILEEQTDDKVLVPIITAVRENVESGVLLSKAMSQHPRVFDRLYVAMIEAGEASGALDKILDRIAVQIEKQTQIKRKVKGAMTYPIVVLCFATLVLIAVFMFIIPVFTNVFKTLHGQLPMMTQMIVNVSNILRAFWFLILPGFGAAIWGLFRFKRTERGRRIWDRTRLRLPMKVGDVVLKITMARFSRTLATLVGAGVDIVKALEITGATSGNWVIEQALAEVRVRVHDGVPIAQPLIENPVFPPMVSQMINIGEETGELEKMLVKIADFYEDEVDTAIAALTSIIEPVMMIAVGAMVGFIVIAMYLPMFKMYQDISNQ